MTTHVRARWEREDYFVELLVLNQGDSGIQFKGGATGGATGGDPTDVMTLAAAGICYTAAVALANMAAEWFCPEARTLFHAFVTRETYGAGSAGWNFAVRVPDPLPPGVTVLASDAPGYQRVRFNGHEILDGGNKHPLKGVMGTLVRRTTMTQAGYDAVVAVPLDAWCHAMATWDRQYVKATLHNRAGQSSKDAPYWLAYAHEQRMVKDGMVYQEANYAEELEVEPPAPVGTDETVAQRVRRETRELFV